MYRKKATTPVQANLTQSPIACTGLIKNSNYGSAAESVFQLDISTV
jgi:hypothetical protein